MRRKHLQNMCVTLLVLSLPVATYAVELDEAARQAAKQNDAKVLSAKTVKQNSGQTHEIKLLTKKGVVKTVKVPGNSKKKKKN